MGKRGAAPTPTAIKIAEGTYRKDKPGGNMVAPAGLPVKPDWLGEKAAAMWLETVERLGQVPGLLCPLDSAALALYCDAWRIYLENQHAGGRLERADRKEAAANIVKLGARFGMTPSDRSSMKLDPQKPSGVRKRQG